MVRDPGSANRAGCGGGPRASFESREVHILPEAPGKATASRTSAPVAIVAAPRAVRAVAASAAAAIDAALPFGCIYRRRARTRDVYLSVGQ
jgi:hypothetical protein